MEERSMSGLDHVKEVGKYIVTDGLLPPMKRHFDYWWSCPDHIQSLKDEIRHFKRARLDMDKNIEEARYRAESATTGIGDWSNEGTQKLEEADRILLGCDELKPWNIVLRYQVGKSAKKTAAEIAKLRDVAKSIRISDPHPPLSMTPFTHEPTTEFESRKRVEEDIIRSLKDDHVRTIAVCGPGGVGKTTMVQRIEERVRNKLFGEVVTVVVSQKINMLNIQKEIAEILGLNLYETTLVGRAHKIRTRLLDSTTKLLIFDDVWKSFSLKDIGVPLGNGSERCKIILTSRIKDVCEEMDVDEVIQIEVLDDEESLKLFREKSGVREDDSEFRSIAKAVAAECKGLPIALVPIAKALKNKDIHTWEDSLLELKRANPTNFPKVREDVYKPLKLSYDFLETDSERALFLLCCLFPEDYNISVELLTLYSFGLNMVEGIRNINEGRNRTHKLVERLKNRFLLIDGHWKDTVKMHDVVRDVAIFIGSEDKYGFLKSLQVFSKDSPSLDSSRECHWMSTDVDSILNVRLPFGSAFPNLRLLLIPVEYDDCYTRYDYDENVDGHIDFEGMKEMRVLSYSCITTFPPTLKLLKLLSTLHLHNSAVKDISVVVELTNLEILYIYWCVCIEELPANIGKLNRLRLLEVRQCWNLRRVTKGVISSLVGLEELKIVRSFSQWGEKVNGSEERNASVLELESLPNLTCLEIDISDSNLVAQDICLSQSIVRYRIYFSQSGHQYVKEYERSIYLRLPGGIAVGNWIQQLVRSTQSLQLTGDGSNYFNLAEIQSLKTLAFDNCSTVKKIDCKSPVLERLYLENLLEVEFIVDGAIPEGEGSNLFQKLEELRVRDLPKLAHLWRSPNQNVSLANLKEIIIVNCPNLRFLFSLETARSLVQLQLLDIERCRTIEQMFWIEIESNLDDEIEGFPRLTRLVIIDCPKLRTKIGKCPNLQTLTLRAYSGTLHLLSSYCTRTLITQLGELSVGNCDTIEELFVDEIEDEDNHDIIFPKLEQLELMDEQLELMDFACLTIFYKGGYSIKFLKLRSMKIKNLPSLNGLLPMDSELSHDEHSLHFFCNQKVEFSCLEELYIGGLKGTINKIWCCLIPNNFFRKLKKLTIHGVDGIRNSMSSSIVETLVNLCLLHIEECQEMVEVIEDDQEICVTSIFPKLVCINIFNLHKLKCFCQWKHALQFPSLRRVTIVDCPEMETFTSGSVSTFFDFGLRINRGSYKKKDLNGSIGEHFMTEKWRREETEEYQGRGDGECA